MYKKTFFVCALVMVFVGLAACTFDTSQNKDNRKSNSQSTESPKAVYLVSESGGVLSTEALEKYPQVVVANSFEALKQSADENTAIWIDKDAIELLDKEWMYEKSQNSVPVVLVGYNDALFSFREILSGFGIEGPSVDWSQKTLEPGFSVWMLKQKTDTSTSAFMKGYDTVPTVEKILAVTDELMEE